MTKYLADIRDFLHDRFGSPFWLSTVVSWLVINWEIPITAIFESEKMGTNYLHIYFKNHEFFYYAVLPVVIGLAYAILSGVIRELIEGSAKVLRSKISSWFYSVGIFSTISLEEHKRELAILQRRLSEISTNEAEFNNLKDRSEKLHNEIENLISEKVSAEEIIKSRAINKFADDPVKVSLLVKDLQKNNYLLSVNYDPDESHRSDPEANKSAETEEENGDQVELNFEDLEKSITVSKKDLSEKGALRAMIEATQESVLIDPANKTTLFLTLLLHKSPSAYTKRPDPELIGLTKDVFDDAIARCIKSKYIDQSSEGYTLTSRGTEFVTDFINNNYSKPLIVILRGLYERTKQEVIDTLTQKHLNIRELAQSIDFNPMLADIINDLRSEKRITITNGIFSSD